MGIQAVRGMKDVLAAEAAKWQAIEGRARQVFTAFGFSEIRTPVLEKTELFARSIGESTDIVEKEMYTFSDRSGDSLTMRPEATAGVLRAYLENKLYAQPGPHKLFSVGPMFRHERPQKGRLRQFHQLNAEVLGDEGPMVDAELMVLLAQLLERLGLKKVELVINSLGCLQCRPAFRQALVGFLSQREDRLCPDCRRRLQSNPLRVLDCKVEGCAQAVEGAPAVVDFLCDDCAWHYGQVKQMLGDAGVVFSENPRLVRGLDYYVRTTFEALAAGLGAQNAVAGGGRYDGLIEQLGGPAQGGIGFAAGVERLALLMADTEPEARPRLFVAALGPGPRAWAFPLVQQLRRQGLWAEMASQDKSLKAQMRRADKLGARAVLIVGEAELASGRAQLKDMSDGSQQEVELAQGQALAGLLGKGS